MLISVKDVCSKLVCMLIRWWMS